ncbi:hypothetical protein TRAPUB_14371 [Trametes pubescens]|uniref:Uncharacterized protein n=1 Tax=Trametes pubescens TaxID=154538 RepID=A0A1M2VNI4_TRAPU|nr:hypothetical protein TRAPUB_14371 [Trametes pubescens]
MLDCLEWRMERGSRLGYLQLCDLMNRDDSQLANDLDLLYFPDLKRGDRPLN